MDNAGPGCELMNSASNGCELTVLALDVRWIVLALYNYELDSDGPEDSLVV